MTNTIKSFVTAMILMAIAFAVPVPAGAVEIVVDPARVSASRGEEVTVAVKVGSVSDLYAFQLNIRINPNHFELVSVEEGPFLNSSGTAQTFFIGPLEGSGKNQVTLAGTRMGPIGGLDGSGTLATLTLRAVSSRKAKINIVKESVRLLDADGQAIPAY